MFFKKKGMALGKRAGHQKKRAWRGTMLKQAGGNTRFCGPVNNMTVIWSCLRKRWEKDRIGH